MKFEEKQTTLFTLGHFANDVGSNALPTLLPILSTLFNFTYTLGGILLSSYQMSSAVLQLSFGYLADKWPRRWIAPLGLIMSSGFISLIGVAPSFPILLIVAVLAGTGSALFHPVSSSMISFSASRRRGTFMSIFLAGGGLAFASGPIVVLALIGLFGLPGTLLLALPGLVLFTIMLKYAGPALHSDTVVSLGGLLKFLKLRFRVIAPIIFALMIRGSAYMGLASFLPSYGVELNMPITLAGIILFVMLLSATLGGIAGGTLSDRYGRKNILMLSLLSLSPILYAFLASSGIVMWILIILVGLALGLSTPVTLVMMHEVLVENRAVGSALNLGAAIGFGALSVALMGAGIDHFGFLTTFQVLAALPIVGGLVVLFFIPKTYQTIRSSSKTRVL